MPVVRIMLGARQVERRWVAESLVIGRGEECGLRLSDPDVSRRHCQLELTPAGYVVCDLGSRNGTLKDGARVTRVPLRNGDVLRIGSHTLRFESDVPPCGTSDERALSVLQDLAPSPIAELEAIAAELRGADAPHEEQQTDSARITPAPAPPAPASSPRAVAARRDLWASAVLTPPSRSPSSPKKPSTGGPKRWLSIGSASAPPARGATHAQSPWVSRRIPLPAAVAAALAAALFVYLLAWRSPAGPRFDPTKPLHHAHHSRSAD